MFVHRSIVLGVLFLLAGCTERRKQETTSTSTPTPTVEPAAVSTPLGGGNYAIPAKPVGFQNPGAVVANPKAVPTGSANASASVSASP